MHAEIMGEVVNRCAVCGAAVVPNSNRAKYCKSCARKVHRWQKNESDRRKRTQSDKLEFFARFLVPEIRKFYESEQGQKEFAERQEQQNEHKAE